MRIYLILIAFLTLNSIQLHAGGSLSHEESLIEGEQRAKLAFIQNSSTESDKISPYVKIETDNQNQGLLSCFSVNTPSEEEALLGMVRKNEGEEYNVNTGQCCPRIFERNSNGDLRPTKACLLAGLPTAIGCCAFSAFSIFVLLFHYA